MPVKQGDHTGHFLQDVSLPGFLYCLKYSGASSSSHGFRVERNVSWKRCATGFGDTFSLVWWVCQKCQPNQQQRVYKPHGIKETARTMGPSEVI